MTLTLHFFLLGAIQCVFFWALSKYDKLWINGDNLNGYFSLDFNFLKQIKLSVYLWM